MKRKEIFDSVVIGTAGFISGVGVGVGLFILTVMLM
jgi:hypothetical protein